MEALDQEDAFLVTPQGRGFITTGSSPQSK